MLIYLRLWEFYKKRIILKIKLKQNLFSSNHFDSGGQSFNETNIEINVDLRNVGLEPTTLVGVDFNSDYELLNNLEMENRVEYRIRRLTSFDEIRIEPNDRKVFVLSLSKNVLLDNSIREINANIIFKTTHKDIKRKIKLKK